MDGSGLMLEPPTGVDAGDDDADKRHFSLKASSKNPLDPPDGGHVGGGDST